MSAQTIQKPSLKERILEYGVMPSFKSIEDHSDLRLSVVNTRLTNQGFKFIPKPTAKEFYAAFARGLCEDERTAILSETAHDAIRYTNEVPVKSWLFHITKMQQETVLRDIGDEAAFEVGCHVPGDAKTKLENALAILEEIWPEAAMTYRKLVTDVVWLRSKKFWSSSSSKANGLIFINPQSDWSIVHYIETLVHESAHVELYLRQLLDPFLLNMTDIADSPLRDDPRPMNGILHASFVMTRTCEAFSRLSESSTLDLPLKKNSNEFLEYFEPRLESALHMLGSSGDFTEAGDKLFRDLMRSNTSRGG